MVYARRFEGPTTDLELSDLGFETWRMASDGGPPTCRPTEFKAWLDKWLASSFDFVHIPSKLLYWAGTDRTKAEGGDAGQDRVQSTRER